MGNVKWEMWRSLNAITYQWVVPMIGVWKIENREWSHGKKEICDVLALHGATVDHTKVI